MLLKNNTLEGAPKRSANFQGYRLDLLTHELFRGARRLALPEQASRVLKLLVVNHGELVPRDRICEEIWSDRQVDFEAGLNTAIRLIRRTLGDDPRTPSFIETVPRRGYRFLVTPRFEPGSRGKPWIWAAPAAVVLILAAASIVFSNVGDDSPRRDGGVRPDPIDSPAYRAYLRGRFAMENHDYDAAVPSLREAIRADPGLAAAYAPLARSLVLTRRQGWGNIVEAQELVDRALELDPTLPEAHVLSAGIALYYWRDREAARAALDHAMNFASGNPRTHVTSAYFHTIGGNTELALQAISRAHQLDPLSPSLNADYGWVHYKARNWDDADRLCRASLELNPTSQFALECMIHVKHSSGDHAEAADYGLQLMALRGAARDEVETIRSIVDARERERAVWAWTLEWIDANQESIKDPVSLKGIALTMLGRHDEAIETLEAAFAKRGEAFLSFAAVDPRVDALRQHPDFPRIAQMSRSTVPRTRD